MKKIIISATILLIGLLCFSANYRERQFIKDAFTKLDNNEKNIERVQLGSGDSMKVILEHSCCSGAGFSAVAIELDDGAQYYSQKNYCGLEEFSADMRSCKNKAQLEDYLKRNDYNIKK